MFPIAFATFFGLLIFHNHYQRGCLGQVSEQVQAGLGTVFCHFCEEGARVFHDDQAAVSQKRHGQGIRLQWFKAEGFPVVAGGVEVCHGGVAKPSLESGDDLFDSSAVIAAQQVESGFCLTAHAAPKWRWYG